MYHFRIYGDSAFGKLPDGTEFVIDADDIQRVNDSEATTIAALKDDYSALLAAIRNAGLMESAPSN